MKHGRVSRLCKLKSHHHHRATQKHVLNIIGIASRSTVSGRRVYQYSVRGWGVHKEKWSCDGRQEPTSVREIGPGLQFPLAVRRMGLIVPREAGVLVLADGGAAVTQCE